MATATRQARTARRRDDQGATDGTPSQFVVFESNIGDYRWEILSGTGGTLAQSASFEDAEAAAVRVRDGAGSTRLEARRASTEERTLVVAPRSRNKAR
jgi:hypothetical protein